MSDSESKASGQSWSETTVQGIHKSDVRGIHESDVRGIHEAYNGGISPDCLDEFLGREHDVAIPKLAHATKTLNGDFVLHFARVPPEEVTLTADGIIWRGQRFRFSAKPWARNSMSTSGSSE